MNADVLLIADCPICGPILEQISKSKDFGELMDLRRRVVPHAKGISDDQRTALQMAVIKREDELCR